MRFVMILFILSELTFAQTTQIQSDKLKSLPADTTSNIVSIDSSKIDSAHVVKDTLKVKKVSIDSAIVRKSKTDSIIDTLFLKGKYAGIGIGWSLGSFDASKMWERTLPHDLKSLKLTDTSFYFKKDTTSLDTIIRKGDTSNLRFTIKESPSGYNMAFPVTLSLVNFNNSSKHTITLSFFLFTKTQKSSIYTLSDSIYRRIDIDQKFIIYSGAIGYLYSRRISPLYMVVENVNRTDVTLGLGISPLLHMQTSNKIKKLSDDKRITALYDSICKQVVTFDANGVGLSFKAGVSTVKRIKKGALEASLLYTMTWNNFFYNNGKRIVRSDIDPSDEEGHRDLSFMSNKFEIGFSLLKEASKRR